MLNEVYRIHITFKNGETIKSKVYVNKKDAEHDESKLKRSGKSYKNIKIIKESKMNPSELKLRKIIRKITESVLTDIIKESSIKESYKYNAKELIAKYNWDKTLEDDRFDMVAQFVKDVAKVEEYSEMEWDQLPDFLKVNLIRHYNHNEIRENNKKTRISDVISRLTIEDITDIVNAFSDFKVTVEMVEEEIELKYLSNVSEIYNHNEIRENEQKTEFDIKEVRNKISAMIEKTKMESRIETGYAYWIDANRLGRLLKREFGKDITMEIDSSVYLSTESMPAQKFYDSKKDRDNNAKKLIQLYSLAYKMRGFN